MQTGIHRWHPQMAPVRVVVVVVVMVTVTVVVMVVMRWCGHAFQITLPAL